MRFLLPCLAALLGTFPAWGQPRDISGHIYGVTVDDVANASDIATALQRMPRFPTVRVVFDRSESWSTYAEPLKKFRPYAYILGMLADSSEMEALSLSA